MKKSLLRTSIITLLSGNLIACGGGGGGSDDTASSIAYTGSTAPASLNSPVIASNYISTYTSYSSTSSTTTLSSPASSSTASTSTTASIQSISETLNGECGGSMKITGTGDNTTGYIDVDVTSNDYCNYGIIGDGNMSMKGYSDDFTLNLNTLTTKYPSYNINMTLAGDINVQYTTSLISTYSNSLVVKDNTANKSYKLANWLENLNLGVYPEQLTLSGKMYHQDYGYVTVSTIDNIEIGVTYPQAGKIEMLGDNSVAWVTFYSSNYLVEIDNNDDGFIDQSTTYSY